MKKMLQKAQQLKEQFSEKVAAATVPAELEQLRIEFLGKKGPISSLMGELRNIPTSRKRKQVRLSMMLSSSLKVPLTKKEPSL